MRVVCLLYQISQPRCRPGLLNHPGESSGSDAGARNSRSDLLQNDRCIPVCFGYPSAKQRPCARSAIRHIAATQAAGPTLRTSVRSVVAQHNCGQHQPDRAGMCAVRVMRACRSGAQFHHACNHCRQTAPGQRPPLSPAHRRPPS